MEILLFSSSVDPVREILQSNNFSVSTQTAVQSGTFECFAKAVVYATQSIHLTAELITKLNSMEGLADRPHAPQLIERGHPIVTMRAGLQCDQSSPIEGVNRVRLLNKLRQQADELGFSTSKSSLASDF